VRAIRRRWAGAEYAGLVEFTTGYGPRSGGRRRPHWNLLIKGVGPNDVEALREVICGVWCEREDARPEAQHVGEVADSGGLMRYLALHFQKESQRPPDGWRGHRFLKSRGYLAGSTADARAAARESLAFKRELWKAIKRGLTGTDAEASAAAERERAHATSWSLVQLAPRQPAPEQGVSIWSPATRQLVWSGRVDQYGWLPGDGPLSGAAGPGLALPNSFGQLADVIPEGHAEAINGREAGAAPALPVPDAPPLAVA
jgi:hypothetical protein